jgi:hypothetical protein
MNAPLPTDPVSIPPGLERVARRECSAILKVIRESYSPSDAIETILVAGFISGARWAIESGVATP